MKKNILCILLSLTLLSIVSCATTSKTGKKTLVGLGHTFRDLRQHTFSMNKDTLNHMVNISASDNMMAFVKEQSGDANIFIKGINSKAMIQKTFHKSDDTFPAFSPDGTKLAFTTKRNGNWDIFIMNAKKGKAKRQITFSDEQEIAPSWSHDGTKVAYCRFSRSSKRWEIWIFDLTNGSVTNLVPGKYPIFSPFDNTIAFQRPNNKGWYSIWTIDDEGNDETIILSSDKEGYTSPYWSPDGKRLVFASGGKIEKTKIKRDTGEWGDEEKVIRRKAGDIWTIRKDGTSLTQLTTHKEGDWAPTWSDNNRIFFTSGRDNYQNIWSVIPEFIQFSEPQAQ